LSHLRQHIPEDHSFLKVASPIECQDQKQTGEFFENICKQGGEGVVLRKSSAWYFEKDSFFIKKVE
jgi:ATP-dependent DNA ligase